MEFGLVRALPGFKGDSGLYSAATAEASGAPRGLPIALPVREMQYTARGGLELMIRSYQGRLAPDPRQLLRRRLRPAHWRRHPR